MSVQASLEAAVSRVADEPIRVVAAGRTDKGVHATQQVVSFDTTAGRVAEAWRRGVTSLSADGIAIVWANPTVPVGFNARFDAHSRRYCYVIADRGPVGGVIGRDLWVASRELDVGAMDRAAQTLLGERDFSSFRASGCQSKTPWRSVTEVHVKRRGAFTVIEIEANAFLLHMVRNIAGALMVVGREAMSKAAFVALRDACDRRLAPPTAPPQGLYLVGVGYRALAIEPRYPIFLDGL